MEKVLMQLYETAVSTGQNLFFALLTLIIGVIAIKIIVKLLKKSKLIGKIDDTVRTFAISVVRAALYVLLIISVIAILGFPIASIITILASASVAVGLALQGALSNLAGGILMMVLKPFTVGDYVVLDGANQVEGTIKGITLFYTIFITADNRRITVPNGTLMNANIINNSAEDIRRVDLEFVCDRGESPTRVAEVMKKAVKETDKILTEPEPLSKLKGIDKDQMKFDVKVWCKTEDYWDVYYDLNEKVTNAIIENNIATPYLRLEMKNSSEKRG